VDEFPSLPPTTIIKPNDQGTLNTPMDKEEFKQKTAALLKYSARLERDVLIKDTTLKPCPYCPKQVANQVVTAEAHRIGTEYQHMKHRCRSCNCWVYDGSIVKEPHKLRSNFYYQTQRDPQNPKYTINGKRLGRPPNPQSLTESKRKVGRPRKTAQP
jgi:hypothetical protein